MTCAIGLAQPARHPERVALRESRFGALPRSGQVLLDEAERCDQPGRFGRGQSAAPNVYGPHD